MRKRNGHGRIQGRAGMKLRRERLDREPLCRDCYNANPKVIRIADVVDHILPLALGGLDVDENCRSLCHDCHSVRTIEQFGLKKKAKISLDGWPVERAMTDELGPTGPKPIRH